MKWSGLLCLLLSVPVVSAAPALIWQQASGAATVPIYTSEDITEKELFRDVDDASLQVVFVIGRQEDGNEALTSWTTAGSLPGVAEVAPRALAIHQAVSVQSTSSLTKTAKNVDSTAIRNNLQVKR